MRNVELENNRIEIQSRLDAEKTKLERNKLGQFATPFELAKQITAYSLTLLKKDQKIAFLEPAMGTGSFYSALLEESTGKNSISNAKGFEIDPHYGKPAQSLWKSKKLDLTIGDFTKANPPVGEKHKFNLIISNPPYVRHHHLVNSEKVRLQEIVSETCGMRLSGLAGLYCYFLGISHGWMQKDGIACWLIPSEFMDVNYGSEIKNYLLKKVSLIRIHRFDPNDLQFSDALVSSAVVWFKNCDSSANHTVEFTYGGTVNAPKVTRLVSQETLTKEKKWTRFPLASERVETGNEVRLSDLFKIKRGIATGDNKFFILNKDQICDLNIPIEITKPILPSPRYLAGNEIQSDERGFPILENQLFLLDCRMSEAEIREKHPSVWKYLSTGIGEISERYLCKSRKAWYFQEIRETAPLLCTYIGRSDNSSSRPFRFILNNSEATATNSYLLLYPTTKLWEVIGEDQQVLRKIWEALNSLPVSSLLGEGRVYGGGLHKLEPKELANVIIPSFDKLLGSVRTKKRTTLTTQTSSRQIG